MDINISNFETAKSAQFYKLKKQLSKSGIENLFRSVSEKKVGKYLLKEIKKTLAIDGTNLLYSFLCFRLETEPSFLKNTTKKEQKHAFLLLIEIDSTLAILKKHVDSPEKFLTKSVGYLEYDGFCHFKAGKNPQYEKVGMQNMSISNAVVRNKSLEANSLNGILSATTASRSIPSNFRMRDKESVYTITPNTSRVAKKDQKANIQSIAQWCLEVSNEIINNKSKSDFISYFAKSVSLGDIKDKCKPTGILFAMETLDSSVRGELTNSRLMIRPDKDGELVDLDERRTARLFNFFKSPLSVNEDQGTYNIKSRGTEGLGKIKLSKSLATISSKIMNGIFIVDESGHETTLTKYINQHKPFSIVFDNPKYLYFAKDTFEDNRLLGNINGLLSVFDDTYNFNTVKSEKEKPHKDKTITEFPNGSLFHAIEDQVCENANVLICDDMGDEWADHISITTDSKLPEVCFIHSKHTGKTTTSASDFQEVVAQALKNLGRINAEIPEYKSKFDKKWSTNYEKTNIPRLRSGNNWNDIETALQAVMQNPNSQKKIIIATPFIKKSVLSTYLQRLANGQTCRPHVTQLIWLINLFVCSCRENGAQPYILCKP